MPHKKKESEDPVKDYGESEIRSNLVPVDEGDVSHAVDVPVRSRLEHVEFIEKQGEFVKGKIPRKTVKRKT